MLKTFVSLSKNVFFNSEKLKKTIWRKETKFYVINFIDPGKNF